MPKRAFFKKRRHLGFLAISAEATILTVFPDFDWILGPKQIVCTKMPFLFLPSWDKWCQAISAKIHFSSNFLFFWSQHSKHYFSRHVVQFSFLCFSSCLFFFFQPKKKEKQKKQTHFSFPKPLFDIPTVFGKHYLRTNGHHLWFKTYPKTR